MLRLLVYCFMIFFLPTVAAQEIIYAPAVWAWKITSQQRTIYLMGELHSFDSTVPIKVDYSLGLKIYDMSSELWTEPTQLTLNAGYLKSQKMSDDVDIEVWTSLKNRLKRISTLILKNKSEAEVDAYLDILMNELENSNPYTIASNIRTILGYERIAQGDVSNLHYLGMNATIKKMTASNILNKKITFIEPDTSVSVNWHKDCGRNENNVVLDYAVHDNDFNREAQKIFVTPSSELKDIDAMFLKNDFGKVINKCVVNSRNHQWLPKITDILNTSGSPIAILVGIGHLSGDDGLIRLLQSQKDVQVERLRTPEF